ncbi:hypothetical protein [Kitasatospora albolonga]|uniref:hypothetical protein n=1 Tax=Kitasatospora albolonga TaxID=68173 RepID=UPI0031E88EFD
MSEVPGRFSRLVRTLVEAMTALPSILAGLFIYAVLVLALGFPRSGLAAGVGPLGDDAADPDPGHRRGAAAWCRPPSRRPPTRSAPAVGAPSGR